MAKAKKPIVKTLPTPEIVKKRMVKGAIRRVYRQSSEMSFCLKDARVELPPAIKKDGTPGAKNQVRYRCAQCKQLFQSKNVQVDHIHPVINLWESEEETDYNTLVERIWCDVKNLQVLCSTKIKDLPKGEKSCHTYKSAYENFVRDRFAEYKKQNSLAAKDLNPTSISILLSEFELQYREYLIEKSKPKTKKLTKKSKSVIN